MNQFISIIGRIGNDARLSTYGDYTAANFSVAVVMGSKKNQETGKYDQVTEWHNVTKWFGAGQNTKVVEYLTKGTLVKVHGSVKADMYDTKQGTKGVRLSVTAQDISLLAKPEVKDSAPAPNVTTAPAVAPAPVAVPVGPAPAPVAQPVAVQGGPEFFTDDFEPPF